MQAPTGRNREKEQQEKRARLGLVRVLLADRDSRTATLVHRILFSFGFRTIDMVTSGEEALEHLKRKPYDLIITEWNMAPTDGLTLVKAIRDARDDNRIRRDIPIIMLTAHSERDNVEAARDAGISEFVVKPFSARTMSERIIQVVDNPRSFVQAPGYSGPCRRRREALPEGVEERRGRRDPAEDKKHAALRAATAVTAPNTELSEQLGGITTLITEEVVSAAQVELLKAEAEFIEWARDDISQLEAAYSHLLEEPGSAAAQQVMLVAAYSIKSQAGIFGYALGTDIATLLARYLTNNSDLRAEKLTVVRKHIDAIVVIFTEKIKDTGQDIVRDLIQSLKLLTAKLG